MRTFKKELSRLAVEMLEIVLSDDHGGARDVDDLLDRMHFLANEVQGYADMLPDYDIPLEARGFLAKNGRDYERLYNPRDPGIFLLARWEEGVLAIAQRPDAEEIVAATVEMN